MTEDGREEYLHGSRQNESIEENPESVPDGSSKPLGWGCMDACRKAAEDLGGNISNWHKLDEHLKRRGCTFHPDTIGRCFYQLKKEGLIPLRDQDLTPKKAEDQFSIGDDVNGQMGGAIAHVEKEFCLPPALWKAVDDELGRQGLNDDARKRVVDCLAGPRPTEGEPPLVAGEAPP